MPGIESYSPLWGVWSITKQIGSGAFGDVYEATRTDTGREYYAAIKHISIPPKGMSIKTLQAEGIVTDGASAQLYCKSLLDTMIKEIDICYELKGHTNFVSYEDHMIVPRQDGIVYDVFIRMELLTSLQRYIADKGITVGGIAKLCSDMCTALTVLEQKRIIHRDIKPANIFVNTAGDFKLGDFGVARHMEGFGSLSVKGTYNYMAPEILKGGTGRSNSDLYSLGLVLYRLLNYNRAPFLPPPPAPINYAEEQAAHERRLSGAQLPPPAMAELSPPLTNAVMRACEYEPGRRFQTASEMKQALMGYREPLHVPVQAAGGAGIGSEATMAVLTEGGTRIDPEATVATDRNSGIYGDAGAPAPNWQPYGGSAAGTPGPAVGYGIPPNPPNNPQRKMFAILFSLVGVIVVLLAVILVVVLPNIRDTDASITTQAEDSYSTPEFAFELPESQMPANPPSSEPDQLPASSTNEAEPQTLMTEDETEPPALVSGDVFESPPLIPEDATEPPPMISEHVSIPPASISNYETIPALSIGDNYEFGGYIWQVLDVQGNQALIIADDIIFMRCYNEKDESCTWESSSIRRWLNSNFYGYFSSSERAKIVETRVRNSDNLWYGTYGGSSTLDYIFLLSIEEAVQYFGDSGAYYNHTDNSWLIDDRYNSERRAWLVFSDTQVNSWLNYIVGERNGYMDKAIEWLDEYNGYPMWWWLRSPGSDSSSAAYVTDSGTIDIWGFDTINYDTVGIRPAMWIELG